MVLDGAEEGRIAERGLDLGAFGEDVPQRLHEGRDEDEGIAREGVPLVADAGVVIREDDAAALRCATRAGKGLGEVEGAVVVGQLVAGQDVADGDLEVVADAEAVGEAGVVEEAGVVPASATTSRSPSATSRPATS